MAPITPRRRPGSKTKSRTGCATCKARHLKCDEAWPYCNRCTTSGWKCPGYLVPPRHSSFAKDGVRPNGTTSAEPTTSKLMTPKTKSAPAYSDLAFVSKRVAPSLIEIPGTQDEQRSFHFFLSRTTRDLKMFADSTFWNHVAFQVAYSEISVRHAIAAVAAMHEDRLREIDGKKPMNEAFSLSQYNKAIRALNSRLSGDKQSYQVTLVSCVVFVYLEFLKGSPESALLHLDNGLRLLPSYKKLGTKSGINIPSSPDEQAVDKEIMRTFSYFRTSALAGTLPRHHEVDVDSEKPGESMAEAQKRLASLLLDVRIDDSRGSNSPNKLDPNGRELNVLFNDWSIWMENYSRNRGSIPTLRELRAIRIIRVHDLLKTIWNSIPVSGQSVNYERHLGLFRAIISLVEQVRADTDENDDVNPELSVPVETSASPLNVETSDQKKKSSEPYRKIKPAGPLAEEARLEMSIAFALYFTVIKCRHPVVRRYALSLLPSREYRPGSTWSTEIFRSTGQYLIDFEEAQCSHVVTEEMSTWPQEHQQIQRIYFLPLYDNDKKTQMVMFVWQPDGPDTEMKKWTRRFNL